MALFILLSCQDNLVQTVQYNDINLYQGSWLRFDFSNSEESIVERIEINNASISYCLYDNDTDFIIDKQDGMVILGSNNKMEWVTVSGLDNRQYRNYWTVKNIQDSTLGLFTNILGNRIYKKDSSLGSTIDSIGCLNRLLKYRNLLPTDYGEMKERTYAIVKSDDIKILLNNPICSNITFNKDESEDSIQSYSFPTTNLGSSYSDLLQELVFVHEHDGISDYCDAASLKDATYVISTDTDKELAYVSTIHGYNYWFNVSQYLNVSIDVVKMKFSDLAYQYSSTGYQKTLPTYKFVANGKYGYKYLTFSTDVSGIIIDIKAEFSKTFINVENCLFMLNHKYNYDRMENGEYVYKDRKNPIYELSYNSSSRIMHYFLIDL